MYVLVFCCCITNDHKISDLKPHLCYLSFCRSEVSPWHSWILHWGFHKAEIKMLAGLHSHLGRMVFFKLPWLSAELFPCGCRTGPCSSAGCGPGTMFSSWCLSPVYCCDVTATNHPPTHPSRRMSSHAWNLIPVTIYPSEGLTWLGQAHHGSSFYFKINGFRTLILSAKSLHRSSTQISIWLNRRRCVCS